MIISSDATAEQQPQSDTLLIVDDNPINLGIILDYFKGFGYRLLVARDGASAIEKAQYGQPDLILLDVLMPGIDGFETCRRLKANPALKDIPVIFATALSDTVDKIKGFQVGGADYVTKPFQPEEVLARVQVHLALRSARRQLEQRNAQLQQEIATRTQAEAALREAQSVLEQRVRERTADLDRSNTDLRAQIAQRRQAEHLREAIYRIAQAAISTTSLTELYGSIHRILGELMPADHFFIAVYDQARGQLTYPYAADQPADRGAAPGKSLADFVLRTRRTLLASPEVVRSLVDEGQVEVLDEPPVDWFGVPLLIEDRLIGVMGAQSYNESVRFGQKEAHLLEFVSAQVAMTIERRQAVESMRQRLEELTLLHVVSIAATDADTEGALIERVTQILHETYESHEAGVLLIDEVSGELIRHPAYYGWMPTAASAAPDSGPSLAGMVAASGRSRLIADIEQETPPGGLDPGTRSTLCVPLKTGNRAIGVIQIGQAEPDAFDAADERLVETIAGQLATAIEKLRLFAETQRHLQRLNALHTIDRAINGSLDLRLTLDIVLDQVTSQLKVDAADILIVDPATQKLVHAAERGFRPATNPRRREGIELSSEYASQVMRARAPVVIGSTPPSAGNHADGPYWGEEQFVSQVGMPIISKGQVKGLIEVFDRVAVSRSQEWFDFLVALAAQAAIAIDNSTLFEALQRSNQELTMAYDATLQGWAHALELRDHETEGHSRRVTDMTVRLAKAMGIGDAELIHVRRGALLHDIGKIGIPDHILFNTGPLTDAGWEIMRKHPTYAFEMLNPIAYLRPALDIPHYHHEKWDGSGYPFGLKGEQIPLSARIFTIVDVWDALTSDRPYRKAWSREKTTEYLLAESEKYFDPRIVEIFLEMMEVSV